MSKVALITGASSGIGKALAYQYAKKGYHLALLARRKERLELIKQNLQSQFPIKVLSLVVDVRDQAAVSLAFKETLDCFGQLDVVIANAGNGVSGKVEELSLEDFSRQFDVNINGVINTVKESIEPLKKTCGCIAIMGSISSYISLPATSAYSMSKFAVRSLAESLRYELAQYRISVTLLCPGFVESEFRQIDNSGEYHESFKDPIPKWLIGSSQKAANAIYHAVKKRKKVLFFTKHAHLLFALRTYSSQVYDLCVLMLPKLWNKKHKVSSS